jgi:CheY-like chemotaxis protein
MDSRKALVAHVEPYIVNLLKTLLEGEGLEVITAPNGPRAMMAASEHQPDLVVLSGHLPDPNHEADGFFVANYIKGHGRLRRTRVILLTTDRGLHIEHRARACGVDRLYAEPFGSNYEFLEVVREQLSQAAR